MRKTGVRLAFTICGVAMLAVTVGSQIAAAQSPDQGPLPVQWDMWNPNWIQRDMWGPGQMGPGMSQRMARHRTFMHQGIPVAYRGARNPLSPDADSIGEGRTFVPEELCILSWHNGHG